MVKVAVKTETESQVGQYRLFDPFTSAGRDPALARIDPRQIACQGEGHRWPRLQANKPIPKNIRWYPNADGTKHIVQTCSECGTERVRDTLPRGIYDADQQYRYIYPLWWVHFTKDDGMSKTRMKIELSKDTNDALEAIGPAKDE